MVTFGRQTRVKFIYGDLFIRQSGFEQMVKDLGNIVRRGQDFRPPFEAFQPIWFDAIERSFTDGGNPVPWPALSPAYASWKEQNYPGKPLLRATDRLYASVTSQTSDTHWLTTPRTIQFSSKVPYFKFHQEGTSKMPARPVITMSMEAALALQALVLNHIAGKPLRR